MRKIPANNLFTQTNRSDRLGDLVASFNLDLTKNYGSARVTRMIQTTSQAVDTDMTGTPVAFKNDGTYLYALAGANTWRSDALKTNTHFTKYTGTGYPADADTGSDMELLTGTVYFAANSKLYKQGTGSYNLGGAGPYSMCAFNGRLYITRAAGIIKSTAGSTIDDDLATPDLTLDGTLVPTFIRATPDKIWIGTISISGKALVLSWDGVASSSPYQYTLEAQGALAGVVKDDTLWVIDSNGRLLVFNGGTFVEKARLPLNDKTLTNATNANLGSNTRFIHPNGMSVVNGKINILIKNEVADAAAGSGSTPEFCPSGIWEYDENIGLYHKYSLSALPVGTNTITDYGQNRVSGVGALVEMKLPDTTGSATGNLLAGATIYTGASTTDAGIFTNDTFTAVSGTTGQYATQGSGYLVTKKIEAANINESWQKIYLFYRQLLTSSDKIVGKYRTTEQTPLECSITWTDTSTFTTTTNVLGKEGYEVEILQAKGSGKCAHITSIDVTGSTYTVHLDDTFTGATGTGKARLQNWTKMGEIQDQTSQFNFLSIVSKTSPWIQFKLCFLFTGPGEFNKALLASAPQQ